MAVCSPATNAADEASRQEIVARAPFTATHFDVSPPMRELAALESARGVTAIGPPEPGATDFTPRPGTTSLESRRQDENGVTAMPVPSLTFDATPGPGNLNPPSPSADVGPNHYVVMSNVRFQVFESGTSILGPLNNNTIWAGFGGACEAQNSGNPRVIYDQIADRWLLAQPTASGPAFSVCVAVSMTPDPTGPYYRWSFSTGTNFPDIPNFALWSNAFIVTTREFMGSGGPFQGIGAYALDRAQMLAGNPNPTVISFLVPPGGTPFNTGDGLIPADLDGSALPPVGSPAYLVGSMDLGGPYGAAQDALTLWRFHADFVTPANSSLTLAATIPTSTFDSIYPCPGGNRRCIPQPGAAVTQYLDILSYRQRVLPRVAYRNFGTHESLVATQSVEAAATPVAGLRWYELRSPGSAPFIHQQSTYAPVSADTVHRWCGSIAMDRHGNMALGYSVSGTTTLPGIRATGRLAADPLHTMTQGEGILTAGVGIQTTTNNRWGDHSFMNVDPADDCTFWYVNEYYPVTSAVGWQLRVSAFKYPGCTPAVSVDDGPIVTTTDLAPIGVARGAVNIRFAIAGPERRRVRVDVFDVGGRRVRSLMDDTIAGGPYLLTWDRLSDAGVPLSSGVYHVRLQAGREQDSEAVVLLR